MDYLYSQLPELVYDPADLTGISPNGTIQLDIDNNKRIINATVLKTPGKLTIIDPSHISYTYDGSSDVTVDIQNFFDIQVEYKVATAEDIKNNIPTPGASIGDGYLQITASGNSAYAPIPTPATSENFQRITSIDTIYENVGDLPQNALKGDVYLVSQTINTSQTGLILYENVGSGQYVPKARVHKGNLYAILDIGLIAVAEEDTKLKILNNALIEVASNLSKEIETLKSEINNTINTSIENLKSTIEDEISPKLDNLNDSLGAETTRAQEVEQNLQNQITANNNSIKLLTDGVSAEEVDGVNDLIQYVKNHGVEVTGIKSDIKKNKEYVDAETSRAKSIESGLRKDVDTIKSDYLTSTDKLALQTQINTIINNPDTEGVIDSISEFTKYIKDHGAVAENFRIAIEKNTNDIATHTRTHETKDDATAKLVEAKNYTNTIKDEIIGTSEDTSTFNTIYGVKKYAEELDTVLQSKITTLEDAVEDLAGVDSDTISDVTELIKYVEDNGPKLLEMQKDISSNKTAITANKTAIDLINNENLGILKKAKTYTDTKINEEKSRAEGVESGLRTDIGIIKGNYLKDTDRLELLGKIDNNTAQIDDVETQVSKNKTQIETNWTQTQAQIKTLQTTIDSNQDQFEAAQQENQNKFKDIQDQIDIIVENPADTKETIDAIKEFTEYLSEHGEIVEGFRTDINTNKGNIAKNSAGIEANRTLIETYKNEAETKYELKGTAQNIIDGLNLKETYAPISAPDNAKNEAILSAKNYTNEEISKLKILIDANTTNISSINNQIGIMNETIGGHTEAIEDINTKYVEADATLEKNLKDFINSEIEKLEGSFTYIPLKLLSFAIGEDDNISDDIITVNSWKTSSFYLEKDTTFGPVVIKFTTDKSATVQKLNDIPIISSETPEENNPYTYTYKDNSTITTDTTFTLTVGDGKGENTSKSIKVSFIHPIYYGVSSNASCTLDDIKNLTKVITPTKSPFTVTAGETQYVYYAVPKSHGPCIFTVGGFEGGFELINNNTIDADGYYIYRSNQSGLGEVTATVTKK